MRDYLTDFYKFFHIPSQELIDLINVNDFLRYFYNEYVGEVKGLDENQIFKLMSKASYNNKREIIEALYGEQDYEVLVLLRASELFFYNWRGDILEKIMKESERLKKAFIENIESQQEKGEAVGITASQFLKIYILALPCDKEILKRYILDTYKDEVESSINFSKQFGL